MKRPGAVGVRRVVWSHHRHVAVDTGHGDVKEHRFHASQGSPWLSNSARKARGNAQKKRCTSKAEHAKKRRPRTHTKALCAAVLLSKSRTQSPVHVEAGRQAQSKTSKAPPSCRHRAIEPYVQHTLSCSCMPHHLPAKLKTSPSPS